MAQAVAAAIPITGATRLFAIVGDPITHVRTPQAFNAHFAAQGIDAVCLAIEIACDDLEAGWAGLKAIRNLDGFVVTMPHKRGAAERCDRLAGDAAHVGVVNVVRRESDGSFTGSLLDGRGFVAGLRARGHDPARKRVYIAGAGGAGQALAHALADSGVAALTLHNRTHGKAAALRDAIAAAHPGCRAAVGTRDASGHDIVVNATSLGLEAEAPLPFDLETADRGALVAEVVMSREHTPLLAAAAAQGHPVQPGLHMLGGQLPLMMEFFRPGRAAGG